MCVQARIRVDPADISGQDMSVGPAAPWSYGLVGAVCDGLGGLWNEFWGVSGLGGGWLGVLGPGGLVLEGVVLSEGVSGLCLWEVNGTTPNG